MPYKIRKGTIVWLALPSSLMIVVPPADTQQVSPGDPAVSQVPDTTMPFHEVQPEGCVQVPSLVNLLVNGGHPDSLVYAPSRDTVSRIARIQVGQCAAAYGGTTDRPWQLLNAARTDLLLNRDAEARALVDRYLQTLAPTDSGRRAWALYLVTADLANAHPPRLEAARQRLAALDQLGAPAARARVLAHTAMAHAASRLFDDSLARSEVNQVIAVAWQMTEDEREWVADELADAFLRKGELELRLRGGAIARGVMDTAVVLVPPGSPRDMVRAVGRLYQLVDQPGPPVEAQFWFGRADTIARPAKGRVMILSRIPHDCKGCQDRIMELRRLAVRFVGQPVEQVHLSQTEGFYRDSAPVPPAEEARDDSAYYYGFTKLSGTIAVYTTKYRWRSDQRRQDEPTPQDLHYPAAAIVIVDTHGIVRYADIRYDNELEELRARLIERLLRE